MVDKYIAIALVSLFVCLILFGSVIVICSFFVYKKVKKKESVFFSRYIETSSTPSKEFLFWRLMGKKKYSEFESDVIKQQVVKMLLFRRILFILVIITFVVMIFSWFY